MTGYDSGPQSIEVLSGGEKHVHQLGLSSKIRFWACLITDAECWQISAAKNYFTFFEPGKLGELLSEGNFVCRVLRWWYRKNKGFFIQTINFSRFSIHIKIFLQPSFRWKFPIKLNILHIISRINQSWSNLMHLSAPPRNFYCPQVVNLDLKFIIIFISYFLTLWISIHICTGQYPP